MGIYLRQAWKDSTALCKILNNRIIQDATGSHRILKKCYKIVINFSHHSMGSYTRFWTTQQHRSCKSCLWNPNQLWKRSYSILHIITWNPTGSYSILEIPIRSHRILWGVYGIVDKHKMTPQHSVKFKKVESYKIQQNPKQNPIKSLLIVIQATMGS